MHRGQIRKSGDPYITHPLAVAQICAELGMDTTTLVAALLHDTVEDTSYTLEALHGDFGPEVAHLVDGVTKFDKAFYGKVAEAETIRKMIVAAGKDVRVLVIKLADRLHNMRTLDARSPASRARIATATLDVLVPLCDRLGIQALKRDLDDVVLYHLEPDAYARIDEHVQQPPRLERLPRRRDRQGAGARCAAARSTPRCTARPRHYYSIWKDTVAGGHAVPLDLPRIAVVVDGPETDCYAALGAIHGQWRPVAGRFKDFIASPKNNLYRSLHTTVTGPDGRLVEVLIRTEAMHRYAEYGVATGYRYPKSADLAETPGADQLTWLQRVLDWEQDTADAGAVPRVAALRPGRGADPGLRRTAARSSCRPVPRRSTWRTSWAPTRATSASPRPSTAGSPRSARSCATATWWRSSPRPTATSTSSRTRPRGPRREWLGFVKSTQAQMQINR